MLLKSMFNSPMGVAREMDRLFDSMMARQALGHAPVIGPRTAYPPLNVWAESGSYHIEAEIPGMSMEEVELLATEDHVTLKGERRLTPPDDAQAVRRERVAGRFERTIALPTPINPDAVEATLVNGVLSVTLPKAEAHTPRRIEVKALPGSG